MSSYLATLDPAQRVGWSDAYLKRVAAGYIGLGAGVLGIGNPPSVGAVAKLTLNPNLVTDANAVAQFNAVAVTDKPLVLQGVSGQTGNLFEAQDYLGSALVKITGAGKIGVGLGSAAPADNLQVATGLGVVSTGGFGYLVFKGCRGSVAAPTASTTGDYLMSLGVAGHDGTNYVTGLEIDTRVYGTVSTGIVQQRTQIYHTKTNGSQGIIANILNQQWVIGTNDPVGDSRLEVNANGLSGGIQAWVSASIEMVKVTSAGYLAFKEGQSNSRMGTGQLSGGTVDVSVGTITNNTRVFVQATGAITNLGVLTVTKNVGAGKFTVTSTNALDNTTFNWVMFEGT